MVKRYCDRCGVLINGVPPMYKGDDKCLEEGQYGADLLIGTKSPYDDIETKTFNKLADLCYGCQNELNRVVTNYMSDYGVDQDSSVVPASVEGP